MKSNIEDGGETGELVTRAPKVNVNYGLTLKWNDKVSEGDADDKISEIIGVARRRGLKVIVDSDVSFSLQFVNLTNLSTARPQ